MPKLFHQDCLEGMKTLDDNIIDAVVTDPPYGLSFMGKEWDHGIPGTHFWQEALRISKPGTHLMAFGGTRTSHRLTVAIEDAGWEIRDTIGWLYFQGFPKNHDVSKAIDREAGVKRKVIGTVKGMGKQNPEWNGTAQGRTENSLKPVYELTEPATAAAKEWDGWGSCLKPAWEPVILARKPLDGTIAHNVQKWGTGAINIDACRVPTTKEEHKKLNDGRQSNRTIRAGEVAKGYGMKPQGLRLTVQSTLGRFPANIIHDGSPEVLALFPETSKSSGGRAGHTAAYSGGYKQEYYGDGNPGYGDKGSAARFFYCAKASKVERDLGCELLPHRTAGECTDRKENTAGLNSPRAGAGRTSGAKNRHPTVKPLALMEYLIKMCSRKGATVLDPFMGSGSTGIACKNLGREFIGYEIEKESFDCAYTRIMNGGKQ